MTEEVKHTKTEAKAEENPSHAKPKEEKAGKEFIIPLRSKFIKTPKYRRAPKAIRAIKEFLVRHMKVYDRDLKKIKIDKYLNEFIWTRGIKNPPAKIKIIAVKEGEFIRVELVELSEHLKFKKGRMEKRNTPSKAVPKKAEEITQDSKTEEEKTEEKEKKAAVVEAGHEMEKIDAKKAKHQTKLSKQPKHQKRMALAK